MGGERTPSNKQKAATVLGVTLTTIEAYFLNIDALKGGYAVYDKNGVLKGSGTAIVGRSRLPTFHKRRLAIIATERQLSANDIRFVITRYMEQGDDESRLAVFNEAANHWQKPFARKEASSVIARDPLIVEAAASVALDGDTQSEGARTVSAKDDGDRDRGKTFPVEPVEPTVEPTPEPELEKDEDPHFDPATRTGKQIDLPFSPDERLAQLLNILGYRILHKRQTSDTERVRKLDAVEIRTVRQIFGILS